MIHGRYSNYSNATCRCPECTRAWTVKLAELRAERKVSGIVKGEHGKYSTYTNWSCRCEPCRADSARQSRMNRARVKQAKLAAALLES